MASSQSEQSKLTSAPPTPAGEAATEASATTRTGAYLRLLAHEMANLVTPVQMAARLLKQNLDPRTIQQAGHILEETVAELSKLIEEVRTAGQVAQGRVNVRLERESLRAIIEQAVAVVRPAIDQARHQLSLVLPEELPMVLADKDRLSRALAQLLENAAHFTPPGGEIVLAAHTAGDRAVVEVSDTGVGIAPEAREAVFALFGRDEAQGDLQFDRRGIGLALVRAIVERHSGSVELTSRQQASGTTVTVSLPLGEIAERES